MIKLFPCRLETDTADRRWWEKQPGEEDEEDDEEEEVMSPEAKGQLSHTFVDLQNAPPLNVRPPFPKILELIPLCTILTPKLAGQDRCGKCVVCYARGL